MDFDIRELAYCGLYCPQCSFRTAYETGDRAHVDAVPERYERLKQLPMEELKCGGCKGENICGDCGIKDCAMEKGLEVCADCDEFPCSKVNEFGNDGMTHHEGALEALSAMRELGREAWLASIRGELACGTCGKRQSWYYQCANHKYGGVYMNGQIIHRAGEIIQANIGAGTHCTLALIDDAGYPTASTITASKADGIKTLYFGTGLTSDKANRIGNCNRASVCFNSEEYNITLVGTIAIVTDPDVKREMWYAGLANHFSGADDPGFCVLRFTTGRYNLLVDWQEAQGVIA